MRFLVLVPLVLVLIAGAASAQQGGQQRSLPGFTPEDMQKYGSLERELREAFDYQDYEKALPILAQQLEILEKAMSRIEEMEADTDEKKEQKEGVLRGYREGMVAGIHYNRACCFSQMGKKDEAIAALTKSINFGYMDLDHMKMDKDLDNIRGLPEYKALLDGLNYNEVYEVYKPESAGEAPAGLIVALHWSSYNEKEFLERYKPVADKTKMVMVVPRGPITLGPGRYDWRRKSDDEDAALKKIKFVIADAKKKHSLDAAPVYLMGVGLGGYFSTLAAFTMPTEVKGAVQVNSYWNKYYMADFLPKAKEAGLKIALIHGKEDPFFAKAETAVEQMNGAGVKNKMIEFEGGKKLPDNEADLIKQAIDFLGS